MDTPAYLADLINDIPIERARAAHQWTSHVPDERGAQMRAEYAATLTRDFDALVQLATTPEKHAILATAFPAYREGYRQRYLAWLDARSRCASTMITGAANFPTERNRKRNVAADKRSGECATYRKHALAAIRKDLTPELQPIKASDNDAMARLQAKIAEAEARQARMVAANKAIRANARKGPEAQIAALVALGFSTGAARDLLTPDFCGRIGFADFQLKNNNAEIRRLKERLASVSVAQATPATEIEGKRARFEDAPADNRVRLFFPGKPDRETIDRLKRAAFRWTPSLGCWQAYRNPRSLDFALREAGIEAPTTEAPIEAIA